MSHYVIRRLLQTIPLLIGVSMIAFAIIHATPGGPLMAYEDPRMTDADRERLRGLLGLDEPLPIQYLKWLNAAVQLDLGRSYFEHTPVTTMVFERLGATLLLMGSALVLGCVIGIPAGIYAAVYRGSFVDNAIRVLTVAGSAVPTWWLGLILIIVMSVTVKIFPFGGMYPLNKDEVTILDRLHHLALPTTVLATGWWVTLARYMRSETLEVLGHDYIRTARAKGLSNHLVLLRHVMPNTLIPIITLLGGSLAYLFSGAALTEAVFSWPGIGQLGIQAAFKRDYPVIQGLLMISALLVVLGNLIADLLYGVVDPRVKYD